MIDVANPQNPKVVGIVDTPGWAHDVAGSARDVAVADEFVYLADGVFGVRVIAIADPEAP